LLDEEGWKREFYSFSPSFSISPRILGPDSLATSSFLQWINSSSSETANSVIEVLSTTRDQSQVRLVSFLSTRRRSPSSKLTSLSIVFLPQSIRSLMKRMGDLSTVPIEPAGQTSLLNACLALPGVVAAGVPGGESPRSLLFISPTSLTLLHSRFPFVPFAAGGFDAIWVLVIDLPSTPLPTPADQVEKVWVGWKETSVCPLSARAEKMGGLKIESVGSVKGLEGV